MCKKRLIFALSMLFLFFLWSTSYTAVVIALKDFSPSGLALFRFLIASAILFALSFIYKVRLPDKKDLLLISVCGVLGISVYNIIMFSGQKAIPVALSSLLLNTYPIFVSIFSLLIFKEFINTFKWIGIIVCFVGIIIASGGNFTFNNSVILILTAAIILSLFDLEQRVLMKKYRPFELTCYFVWAGTLALCIFLPALIKDLATVKSNSLITAVYLGAFPSVAASVLWAKLIFKYSVSSLACYCYISPIFTAIVAFLFLNQMPGQSVITGAIVVISGLFIIHFSKSINLNFIKNMLNLKSDGLYTVPCRVQLLIHRFPRLFHREK
ncbi:MAG TPA: EamA family transporter [Candidatus Gastranaerophilales bacterium]|nr:EamA family transporter [Candidatus Gastranaerophilales bacterium]